ncbi:testis-expressed protein 264 [Synchiropus splendidus]|uniref:testis-expressed protein 264 n=1 Tax=Synchiropus splendidus TaxID=270530 RepID=UPI00237E80C6|nr:testis-expressed protein 264 [Synchiropus splendidus]
MSDLILLLLIVVLLVCLLLTLGGFFIYSGLLADVDIKTGPPPIKNVTIAYKFREGSYKDCGATFTEACSIAPQQKTIGVFYDDPKQRPADKCRYIVGSILCEGEDQPDQEMQKLYEKFGFKVFSLPEVTHAVTTTFPCNTSLSHVVASYRVYPKLGSYIEERKLCAFPFIEICGAAVTSYMAPLSRQTDFFVPEMKDEVKTEVKEEESDDDRGTDITGADSHSDVSSVSGGLPWDSRETSLAASTAASLASSLPLRDVMDASEDSKPRDLADRSSNESMGSGSSFEELDMDQDEDGGEREGGEEEDVPEAEDGGREAAQVFADKEEPVGDGEE